jgi:transcriptional regulator with XRE-family HTH domain
MDKKIFSERLKSQREAHGFTQKSLAQAVGFAERNYQHYESQTDPITTSLAFLLAVAEKLDVSIDYLLNRTTNPKVNR